MPETPAEFVTWLRHVELPLGPFADRLRYWTRPSGKLHRDAMCRHLSGRAGKVAVDVSADDVTARRLCETCCVALPATVRAWEAACRRLAYARVFLTQLRKPGTWRAVLEIDDTRCILRHALSVLTEAERTELASYAAPVLADLDAARAAARAAVPGDLELLATEARRRGLLAAEDDPSTLRVLALTGVSFMGMTRLSSGQPYAVAELHAHLDVAYDDGAGNACQFGYATAPAALAVLLAADTPNGELDVADVGPGEPGDTAVVLATAARMLADSARGWPAWGEIELPRLVAPLTVARGVHRAPLN